MCVQLLDAAFATVKRIRLIPFFNAQCQLCPFKKKWSTSLQEKGNEKLRSKISVVQFVILWVFGEQNQRETIKNVSGWSLLLYKESSN